MVSAASLRPWSTTMVKTTGGRRHAARLGSARKWQRRYLALCLSSFQCGADRPLIAFAGARPLAGVLDRTYVLDVPYAPYRNVILP